MAGTRHRVIPEGGGPVPRDADVSGWGLRSEPVTGTLTLPPRSGAILLDEPPPR